MTRGRRTAAALVQQLDGSDEAKARLVMLLDVWAGQQTAVQAVLRFGLSERRFHQLRTQCLQAALTSLEPRPLGRPARRPDDSNGQLAALQNQVQNLRLDLRAAQIREEIALAMPHLHRRGGRSKTAGRKKARKSAASGDGSNDCKRCGGRHPRRPSAAAARPASARRGGWSATSAPTRWPSPAGRRHTAYPPRRWRYYWGCPCGR
jgi:hypothetical protein